MRGAFSSKRCFLFDLDGTLVDSTPAHARAFVDALRHDHPALAAGFEYPKYAGRPTREVFTALGLGAEPQLSELTERKQGLYREALARGEVGAFPGVEELLSHLQWKGCRLFVVTSASRISTRRVLALTKLEPFFEGVVTAEDTHLGKPSPEPYLLPLSIYGLDREDCLAIEDGESGIRAAQGAGLDVVLIHTELKLDGVRNVKNCLGLSKLLT